MHATAVMSTRRHLAASLALAMVLAMSGCAAAGNGASADPPGSSPEAAKLPPLADDASKGSVAAAPATGSAHFDRLPADSRFQRFIVKYRADSVPGKDPARARERLAIAQAESGITLEWLRRLGVDADVFKTAHPLDRQDAAALMDRFSADPDVEYIEVDSVLTIRPGVDVPPVKPLSE